MKAILCTQLIAPGFHAVMLLQVILIPQFTLYKSIALYETLL